MNQSKDKTMPRSIPEAYRRALEVLAWMRPEIVPETDWLKTLGYLHALTARWGYLASALEWSADDLLALPASDRLGGLFWRLKGRSMIGLDAVRAVASDGAVLWKRPAWLQDHPAPGGNVGVAEDGSATVRT